MRVHPVATIGYEGTTLESFIATLVDVRVELLVDIRAVASSRRPGFSKSKLAARLSDAGIGYVHLRALGTPADGRAAARAGRHAEMRRIFAAHLGTHDAQAALHELADIVAAGRRVALLCFEARPEHCHRRLVAEGLAELVSIRVTDLLPGSSSTE